MAQWTEKTHAEIRFGTRRKEKTFIHTCRDLLHQPRSNAGGKKIGLSLSSQGLSSSVA